MYIYSSICSNDQKKYSYTTITLTTTITLGREVTEARH